MPLTSFATVKSWLVSRLGSPTRQNSPTQCPVGVYLGTLDWGRLGVSVWLSTPTKVDAVTVEYPQQQAAALKNQPRATLSGGVGVGSPVSALTAVSGVQYLPNFTNPQGEAVTGRAYAIGSGGGPRQIIFSKNSTTIDSIWGDGVCAD